MASGWHCVSCLKLIKSSTTDKRFIHDRRGEDKPEKENERVMEWIRNVKDRLEEMIKELEYDRLLLSGAVELLCREPRDTYLAWAMTMDGYWHLCRECPECFSFVQYPYAMHRCPGTIEESMPISTYYVGSTIVTSVDEILLKLCLYD